MAEIEKFSTDELHSAGIDEVEIPRLLRQWEQITSNATNPNLLWANAANELLRVHRNFNFHLLAYKKISAAFPEHGPISAWQPGEDEIQNSHLGQLIKERQFSDVRAAHRWSAEARNEFWIDAVKKLQIQFSQEPKSHLDIRSGIEHPYWLKDAQWNIAANCLHAPDHTEAVISGSEVGDIESFSVHQLRRDSYRVANGLHSLGCRPGDRVAIDMPMNYWSVAIYLGIIHTGACVVSIADSFSEEEIATRLRISEAKWIFTQDVISRGGKNIPLYNKVCGAQAPSAIVLAAHPESTPSIREGDHHWKNFLSDCDKWEVLNFESDHPINILFSSGTTGDPKAIVWDQTTALKAAVDGYYHQDIREGERVAWPTNLGWMMGPWLIFAALLNRGTIMLYEGAPNGEAFGQFIQKAQVNILGLVPSMVKSWRATGCMESCDWSNIRLFSSTGEASNPEDYLYLMYLAHYRPVIEYCGGTEIGGGYITGTLLQDASPGTFTLPCMGLDFCLLDDDGKPTDDGEVYLIPPSMGLSRRLLNRDHHEVYFKDCPRGPNGEILRRHGDQIQKINDNFYRAQGRTDDTMNLGGIKTSSAEIERVVNRHPAIMESAAIALPTPGGGPSQLVLAVVPHPGSQVVESEIQSELQGMIKESLNPLFKISAIRTVDQLPRTASNKIMRRVLRDQFNR